MGEGPAGGHWLSEKRGGRLALFQRKAEGWV